MAGAREQVVRGLREMARALKLEGAQPFRIRAYEQAATRLAALSEKALRERSAAGTLTRIPGIGPRMAAHVEELLRTGGLAALTASETHFPPDARALLRLPGLGPRRAAVLWDALRTADPARILLAARQGRLRGLPGFGPGVERALRASLAPLVAQGAGTHRSLAELRPAAETLARQLFGLPGVEQLSIAGPVRRWCETAEDLTVVIAARDPRRLRRLLARELKGSAIGEEIRLTHFPLEVEVRLVVVDAARFAAILLHHTGAPAHLAALSARAKERGLRFGPAGVRDAQGALLPAPDETALYARLGLPFIPPELREGRAEVEVAAAGALPELITHRDIRGVVHSHSTWSDGRASLRRMAIAARARGMRYLTVTDHSQTAHYARGLTPARLRQQWEEIDILNRELGGFRLLRGIESDILQDGALDLPSTLLQRLEVVIASIHTRHGMQGPPMTRRIFEALDNPHTQILGHPTGRRILERPAYEVAMGEVLERARARGVCVEINGSPRRLDLSAAHAHQAIALGVRLVLSCDAHSEEELENLRYAVATARRAWVHRDRVANTLDTPAFLAALRAPP